MYKTTARNTRRAHHGNHDVYGDLAKIKHALYSATSGIKGKAGAVLSQSLDDVKERSAALQENFGTTVAKRPFKSVSAALLAGLLIGYFIHK